MPQPVITVRKSHKWRLAAVLFVWAVLGSTAFWWYRHYKNTNEPERGIEVQSLADRSDVRRLAVSPDGSYVAYSPESNELRLLQVATKQDISIAQPSKDKIRQIVFSPDGNYLYFLRSSNGAGSGSGILRIAAVGGPTTRIVSDATDYGFSLSPDASRIAYLTETKSDSQITISRTDGSDRKILATRSANHPFWTPAWSPAGDEIAVIENLEDGNMQLDLVSVKDGKVRSIRAWPGAGQPAWSSDGSIVFLSVFKSMADPVWQIWSVNPNTGAGQPITSGTVDYYQWSLSPARSGDLAAIVFSYRTSIWIVDSLTPAVRRIPSFEGEGSNGVSWVGERIATTNPHSITVHSQDDKQIKTDSFYYVLRQVARCGPAKLVSFVAEDKGPPRFSYLELDSGRDVPFGEKADSVPSCSQDGSIAIYLRCDEKKECYLLSRKLPSGTPQPITSPGAPLFAPLISPDGKLVLAEKQPDPTKPLEWAVIIPTGKGSPQPISIPVPMDSVGANLAWNLGHFRWSPDGRSILFPVGQNGIDNIWSYPVAGGRAKQITHFDTDGIIAFDVDAKGRLVVCRGAMVRRPVLIHHSR